MRRGRSTIIREIRDNVRRCDVSNMTFLANGSDAPPFTKAQIEHVEKYVKHALDLFHGTWVLPYLDELLAKEK